MGPREAAGLIEETAALWVAQLDRGLSSVEQSELDAWTAADARHLGALARAQAVWQEAGRAQIFQVFEVAVEAPALRRRGVCRALFRVQPRWASAAAIVIACCLGLYSWYLHASTYVSTAIGEIRHVPLKDGSSVTLNTGSRIEVDFSADARIVHLNRGEALFNVASDPNRPFVVEAGRVRVRALGTEFSVRRMDDSDARVTVTRGSVDVWREAVAPEPSVRLSARMQTRSTASAVETPSSLTEAEAARSVAWQEGIIDLDGRTLAEAAVEFNRYNQEMLVIADPDLSQRRVVGRFHTSDPRGFAKAAAAMLDARVRLDADHILIER